MPAESETLIDVPMFRSLPRATVKAQDARCDWRRVAAKEWVIDYQDDDIDVFFVVAGAVRVLIYAKSGREVILADLEAGGFSGEMAPIDGHPRSASVLAASCCGARGPTPTIHAGAFFRPLRRKPQSR